MGRTAARNRRRRRGLLDLHARFLGSFPAKGKRDGATSRRVKTKTSECSKGVNAGRVTARAGAARSASRAPFRFNELASSVPERAPARATAMAAGGVRVARAHR
jgi:hypothetical protein